MRGLFLCLAWTFLLFQTAPAYEQHINCGGSYYDSYDYGFAFQSDNGYSGGEVYSTIQAFLMIDTNDGLLYCTGRTGHFSYSFPLTSGWYILRLGFSETQVHAAGTRVFHVVCEGDTILGDLDLLTHRRGFYPVVFAKAVEVTDGQINIEFVPSDSSAIVSYLSVLSSVPDSIAPPAPQSFGVLDGFEAAILSWDLPTADDVAGHNVYRCTLADSEMVLIKAIPYLTHWTNDETADLGQTYGYCMTALDVYGMESEPSDTLWCSVLDHTSSALPVYRVYVDSVHLQSMNEDVWSDDYYPATLVLDGESHDIEIRYRGAMGRLAPKKSWKMRLPSDDIVPGRDHVNLVAESNSNFMMKSVLGYNCFDSTIVAFRPAAFKVHFEVNDGYMGVFTDVEETDKDFFDLRGISPIGNFYKVSSHFEIPDTTVCRWEWSFNKLTNKDEGIDDVKEFIIYLNEASEAEFPQGILDYLHLDAFLDHYAMNILLMNIDFVSTNIRIYHDPNTDLWTFHPWDLDAAFVSPSLAINYGTKDSPQSTGAYNVLFDRILNVPQFRLRYVERLTYLAENVMHYGVLGEFIESTFNYYVFDGDRDVWKRHNVNYAKFHACPSWYETIMNNRSAYVLSLTNGYADEANGLMINEFMAINDTTIVDEHGDHDDWIELLNIQDYPISLGGKYLTDDYEIPTRWAFPDTSIGAGEYLLIWTDNEPTEGPLHTTFKLSGNGEDIYIFEDTGDSLIMLDGIEFDEQTADISYGRCPDGWVTWELMRPTPRTENTQTFPPSIEQVHRSPLVPDSSETVLITALVSDQDGDLKQVDLTVFVNSDSSDIAMQDDGAHGDGGASDGVFGAYFGPHPCGTRVEYYITARDSLGLETTDPADTPDETHGYETCAHLPVVLVNEFMALNDSTILDEYGESDDWLEIYNPGADTVNLLGLHLSDNFNSPTKWELPDTILFPGEYLLIWTDGQDEQGPLHAGFRLAGGGEEIGIFGSYEAGYSPIDTLSFGPQSTDISFGRYPDGDPHWCLLCTATPGCANIDPSGIPTHPEVVRTHLSIPAPNPFRDRLHIVFEISSSGSVNLSIYDVTGRLVRRLLDAALTPRSYEMMWDGRDDRHTSVASGIYFAVLSVDGKTQGRKIVLLR